MSSIAPLPEALTLPRWSVNSRKPLVACVSCSCKAVHGRRVQVILPVLNETIYCSAVRGLGFSKRVQQLIVPGGLEQSRQRTAVAAWRVGPPNLENLELAVGDSVALVAFALYKQIASIVTNPHFPGWLSPMRFNPIRFVEFASFAGTLVAAWLLASYLTGGYSRTATRDLPTTLTSTSITWLVAMPVAAAQLVLSCAAESHALVATEGFASALPLAASGPGEPVATAAGVLGVMSIWRCFYASYLDPWSRFEILEQALEFRRVLAQVLLFAACCTVLLQLSQMLLGDELGQLPL